MGQARLPVVDTTAANCGLPGAVSCVCRPAQLSLSKPTLAGSCPAWVWLGLRPQLLSQVPVASTLVMPLILCVCSDESCQVCLSLQMWSRSPEAWLGSVMFQVRLSAPLPLLLPGRSLLASRTALRFPGSLCTALPSGAVLPTRAAWFAGLLLQGTCQAHLGSSLRM